MIVPSEPWRPARVLGPYRLNIGLSTVYQLKDRGEIRVGRAVRFSRRSIEDYERRHTA